MWKVCPVLCVLLLLVAPRALLAMLVSAFWNAAILGALANEPQNAYLLATSVLIGIALDYVYSSATIAIFLQRIFFLLFPTGKIRKFNVVVCSVLGASAVGSSITTFVLILSNVSPDEKPLPPGCFSFNCLAIKDPSVRVFPHTVTALSSIIIVTIGTFMFALIYKHRKRHQNATSVKVSKFALYVFYIRLVFELIPFVVDVVLSQTAGIQLGKYLGPFGAFGGVLDITATTALYYKLFRPSKAIAVSNSTMESGLMSSVVFAEFSFIFCLSLVILVLRHLIHRHKSVRAMWKLCPVLCVLLILVVPRALLDLLVPVLWNAAILGALDNEPRNAYLLATPVLIEIALDYVNSGVTIAIFLQRIFYLLFPIRRIKKFNNVVFSVLGVSAVGCAIVTIVLFISNVSPDERPLSPGCFSFNCMTVKDPFPLLFSFIVTAMASGVIIAVGTFMFALIYKHRKRHQNATSVKVSKFALYVFYIRLVFELIPFVVDVTLSQTAGIQLGKYLGPYGAIGAILDTSATTAVYYRLFKPPKQIATTTR